ncbi:MAG: hypothetical protein FD146_2305 [Anaerolineaceae bacterium]|nr:MAG: hypothetical protein FD146_2305 [Anaerolineaceae bacterium]
MTTILVQIFFGWPAIIVSLLAAIAGLTWKRWWLLLVSAALFLPVSWYLSGYPAIRGFGFLLPIFLLGAAFAVRARKFLSAWLLASPVFLASAWLAVLVLSQ